MSLLARFWAWVDARVMLIFLDGLNAVEAQKEREARDDDG
jgi:hypothetical protein